MSRHNNSVDLEIQSFENVFDTLSYNFLENVFRRNCQLITIAVSHCPQIWVLEFCGVTGSHIHKGPSTGHLYRVSLIVDSALKVWYKK